MKSLFAILLGCVAAGSAFAQNSVPDVVTDYQSINVFYSERAAECNLEHSAAYEARLREKLAAIGVTQSDNSVLVANLGVTGQKFGLIGAQCMSAVELVFAATLRKENIVTNNPAVREAVDKLEAFPIVVYESGMFAVQPQGSTSTDRKSTASKEAALKMIDELVKGFDGKRM
jgi:hypothetical protein